MTRCPACLQQLPCRCAPAAPERLPATYGACTCEACRVHSDDARRGREHAWRSVLSAVVEGLTPDQLEALREGLAKRSVYGEASVTALVDALLPVVLAGERMMDG